MTLVSPAPDLEDEIIVTGCPFEFLAHGPQLADLHVRVARAAQKIHGDSKPMELLMADPTLDTTALKQLGFTLAAPPYGAHATVRRLSQAWTRHHYYTAMLAQFLRDVDQHVLASGAANDDKTITQTLTAGDVISLWTQAREDNFRYGYYGTQVTQPTEADMPTHVALVLQALAGPAWTIDPRGMVATRILPGHPLRNIRGGMTPQRVSLPSHAMVDVLAWVMLPATMTGNGKDELLYAAAVGGQKKLRALWAAILDGKRHEFKMPKVKLEPSVAFGIGSAATTPDVVTMRRVEGSGQYAAFWNELPLATSGLAHLVLEHTSASQPTDNQPFLHVTGEDGLPDLPHFFRQLDVACPLPLDADWTQALWDKGRHAQLIRRLPSSGCAGYWVAAENLAAWANIVSAIVSGDETVEATMESFGGVVADEAIPQLEHVINDYGDDDQAAY